MTKAQDDCLERFMSGKDVFVDLSTQNINIINIFFYVNALNNHMTF